LANARRFGSRQGAEALRSPSANRNDISHLQKATTGKKLSLTEACIWRISAYYHGLGDSIVQ